MNILSIVSHQCGKVTCHQRCTTVRQELKMDNAMQIKEPVNTIINSCPIHATVGQFQVNQNSHQTLKWQFIRFIKIRPFFLEDLTKVLFLEANLGCLQCKWIGQICQCHLLWTCIRACSPTLQICITTLLLLCKTKDKWCNILIQPQDLNLQAHIHKCKKCVPHTQLLSIRLQNCKI